MTNRLATIFVLGFLGALLVAGAVGAAGGPGLAGDDESLSIDLPESAGPPPQLPDCSNGFDDDADSQLDLDDPQCKGKTDYDEQTPRKQTEQEAAANQAEQAEQAEGELGTEQPATEPTEPAEPTQPTEPTEPNTNPEPEGPKSLPDSDNPFKDGGDTSTDKNKGGGNGDKGKGNGNGNGNGKGKGKGTDDGKGNGKGKGTKDRNPDGSPTNANPSVTVAPPGAAPIGVPNFIIDQFTIPPFLLSIYQACGTEYGIPWQVLASINRIETAFGTNLNVSTAGAVGWMQFLPSTWKAYGVDANGDGRKDPYNPVDAICGAARYLNASGGEDDLRSAIFSYNHADWYVDEVLLYARQYGKLPSGLVSSLTGLTEGAHFPVAAKARYADDISERQAQRRATPRKGSEGNVADVISNSPTRRGINIFAKQGAPLVAVNDGTVKKIGKSKKLGTYVILRDAYGNDYTYSQVGELAEAIPVAKDRKLTNSDFKLITPGKGQGKATELRGQDSERAAATEEQEQTLADTEDMRERMYALPERKANRERAALSGQLDDLGGKGAGSGGTYKTYFTGALRFDPETMDARPLRQGARVIAGTVLGEVGAERPQLGSHVHFAIEPAGRGSRKIDPKPILDGWKLLEATAIYRAAGKSPFSERAGVGEILLMSKGQLQQRVLRDPKIEIYACGRADIKAGVVDRRVLASLSYLAARGLKPTVTSLKCGHGFLTASGNVSHHSSGNAVDIAAVNGIPILGNQGRGSITEAALTDLLKLQGAMAPAQIISLMEIGGPTFAMGDHADHIHLGFNPTLGPGERAGQSSGLLDPNQWDKLLDRIGELDQPEVPIKPSEFSLPSGGGRASNAHQGE